MPVGSRNGKITRVLNLEALEPLNGLSIFRRKVSRMPHLNTCLEILRRLIAKGDMNGVPFAERAINEYWDATLERARKSGLRLLQYDVVDQRNAVIGNQRNFAEAVNDYIERKLRGE